MPDVTTTTASSGLVLDRHLAVRQRAGDVEQQPARDDDGAFAGDLRLDGRAQRELHVGRSEVQPAGLGAQLDPAEHEHGRARRDTARNERQLGASSSFATVIRSPVPTTVSESII